MSNLLDFTLEVLKTPRPSFLHRSLARLSDRARRLKAVNELENLSDRHLRDIGVERGQIGAIAEREIAKLRTRA